MILFVSPLHNPEVELPTAVIAAMTAIKINAAKTAYSVAVVPRSSSKKQRDQTMILDIRRPSLFNIARSPTVRERAGEPARVERRPSIETEAIR